MSAPESLFSRLTIRRELGLPVEASERRVEPGAVDLWGALAQGLHRNARFVVIMGFVLGVVIAAACLNRWALSA